MKESKVQYEDVKTICDRLVADGIRPTVTIIRQRLGHGSYTTITEHFRRWNEKLPRIKVARDEIVDEVVVSLEKLVQTKVEHYLKEYKFRIIELNHQLDEVIAESKQAEILCQALSVQNEELRAKLAKAEGM